MSHLEPDAIALLALGEHRDDDRRHLAGCESCRNDVAGLQRVVIAGRSLGSSAPPPAAPEVVWSRIARELRLSDANPVTPTDGAAAEVAELSGRRRPRFARLAAASPALLAVVVAAVVLGNRGPTVVAETPLFPVGGGAADGTVALVEDGGGLAVRLSFVSPPPEDAFYEVWLMDSGAERLVSLGPVSDRGLYPLPEGLDPDTLPVVDVSREPLDGDPAHSGDSLVRGTLPI